MKNPIKLRTIFMGTSSFAVEILDTLLKNDYNIISVYTQPDKKSGRHQEIKASAIKVLSQKKQLPILEPEKFDEKTISSLKSQKPDLIIVASYGKILPKTVLDLPGFGAINVHPSLLPKFRGPSPIQNTILDGVSKTGVTLILMNEEIDAGDIISQKEFTLSPQETYPKVLEKASVVSAKLLLETLPRWVERKIKPLKQNENQATYCQLIERNDGKIIWENDAQFIYNQWRAFIQWPGIFTYWESKGFNLRLKLSKIKLLKKEIGDDYKIGQVFKLDKKVAVRAGYQAIILEKVQLEGKKEMKIDEFINGHPTFIGSLLK